MASIRRPEHTAPPEIFYGVDEAEKYTSNTRIMQIQVEDLLYIDIKGPPQETLSFRRLMNTMIVNDKK